MDNIKEKLKERAESKEDALQRLYDIVKILRKECPWDREQNHDSLRQGMIEEAYEVCEAIDKKDFGNLKEELGDVLLQVIFHSILGEEEGKFILIDVINEECEKMIRRHPHIFALEKIKTVDKVFEKWENIKRIEQGNIRNQERLREVPSALPALIRSRKVQKKAAETGFDWDDISGALEKVNEETEEFLQAIALGNNEAIMEEMGDLLFSIVNTSRFLNIQPEEALNATTEKFIKRFSYIEDKLESEGVAFNRLSLEQLDELWNEAKENQYL